MTKHVLPLLGLPLLCAGHAAAAPAKAAPKKPAAVKPALKTGGPVVLGTQQLPGDFGKLGTTYTIGKSDPINFTLRSAEFSVARVCIGDHVYAPTAEQKLLVLRYTVQNPQKAAQHFYWAGVQFTAVDADDVNHEYIQAIGRDGTSDSVAVDLKPAQKLDLYSIIVVPAKGVVPKLIVTREEGAPVVRYDLRGKTKMLAEPFAAASDGATALEEVPAPAGTPMPLGAFDARLDSVAYTTSPMNGEMPEDGKRYLAAVVTLKNMTTVEQHYYWATFKAELRDADGERVEYNQTMLKASRDEKSEGYVKPGEEIRVRFYFSLPADLAGKMLYLSEGEGRIFAFDVSGAK